MSAEPDEDVDVIGEFSPCVFGGDKKNFSSNVTEIAKIGYTVKTPWLHDGQLVWQNEESQEMFEIDHNIIRSEIFDESDIPEAEFEEEIIADETFENFVSANVSVEALSPSPTLHPRSLLLPQNEVKFKQRLTIVNRSLLKVNHHSTDLKFPVAKTSPKKTIQKASKFRQTVNLPKPTNFVLNEHTMKIFKNIQKRKAQAMAREKKKRPPKAKSVKLPAQSLKSSKKVQLMKKKVLKNYIGPQKPKIVDPKTSGEIVRVKKAESDVEVDILSNSEDEICNAPMINVEDVSIEETDTLSSTLSFNDSEFDLEVEKKLEEVKDVDSLMFETLNSLEVPESEINLETSNITNLERFFHSEFFTLNGSSTKTPERYLKIRNHMITMWKQQKPLHLSKTSSRNGLKNCGDVNCIGRVHSFLEQIGAINFDFGGVTWIRPLKDLFKLFQENIRNKNVNQLKTSKSLIIKDKQRIRNAVNLSREENYTIQHNGIITDSMINRIKSRSFHRTQFELIKCQEFSDFDNPAPFQVSVTLSCLLCLYLHSLSSKLEIMGFLGGKSEGQEKINLTRYKPCRTSKQTAINCEMCPVSQVEQSSNLMDEGFELLGWFHSHPNFPPIPSRTDLSTQTELQLQFAPNNKHFIGFILSCVDMQFKCIYMQEQAAFELKVEIVQDYSDLEKDIFDVLKVVERNESYESVREKFFENADKLLKELSITESIQEIIRNVDF